MSSTNSDPTAVLQARIIERYLGSPDFNGLFFDGGSEKPLRDAAKDLVNKGLVQVVSEADYPNPHIRPWASRRTLEEQVASIDALKPKKYGLCLYPTSAALKSLRLPRRFDGQPFRQAMAKGKGTLELAYFQFDVLEPYRNDPRYHFGSSDFGASMGIGDEAFDDDKEPDRDKTSLSHIGFAYDLSGYRQADPDSPMVRRVAAFYIDLARLTPEHQQRWKTYQVPDDNLEPHPVWWMSQMGQFPDGLGPFQKLFSELKNLNELFTSAYGFDLFAQTEQPRDFGWILRPSQREWDSFIQQLDKLLSENIRHDTLTVLGVRKLDAKGQPMGTLNRLAEFLESTGLPTEKVRDLLKPLRDVRTARQKPAHSLRANITDKTFVHKQVNLLSNVNDSLQHFRVWMQKHPANKDWKTRYDELLMSYHM